jgi:homoserine kinase type II
MGNLAQPSWAETFEHLRRIVSNHYDLGDLVRAEVNDRGYINISFGIETHRELRTRQYVLRRYRRGTHENKIRFEHALMQELLARKFQLSPRLIPTREDATYVKVEDHLGEGNEDYFVTILSYLPGEDKYRWDDPFCTQEELKNSAEVLARYHNTIFGWEDMSNWDEPRMVDRIPLMAKKWREYAKTGGNTAFEAYFQKECDYLFGVLDNPQYITARRVYDALPHLVTHGDYHPGNLKFQDGEVVGLFDFDWAKMDARCCDIGIALTYFCTAWEQSADGNLLLDRAEIFLQSYQEAAKAMQALGALNALEIQCLPQMIVASNLYVLDWTIGEFFTARPDAEEYLRYLQHGIRALRWLESNWGSFVKRIITESQ